MIDDHVATLRVLERSFDAGAKRAMLAGPSPFTGTLPTFDMKVNRAEMLHAIGEAYGRAADTLEREYARAVIDVKKVT